MASKQLTAFKQQRNGYHTNIKKQLAKLTLLQQTKDDRSITDPLKAFIENTKQYQSKVDDLDSKIILMEDDDEMEEEAMRAAAFQDTVVQAVTTAGILLTNLSQLSESVRRQDDEISEASSQRQRQSVKLPKLEIEPYGGDPLRWQEFWDGFQSSVDNNAGLADVDKFKYLRSYLTDDALSMVEGYRLTSSNYSTVVEALKERFGNPEVAVFAHLEKLLAIPSSDESKLQRVYDECEKHIRSLVALGLTEDTFRQVFTPILLSKLPRFVRIQLHRLNGATPWKLSKLRELMKDEIQARGMSDCYGSKQIGSRSGVNEQQQGSNRTLSISKQFQQYQQKPRPMSQTVLSNQTKPKLQCTFCKGLHFADQCRKYQTTAQRKLQLHGRCFKCLAEGHDARSCTRQKTCFFCKKNTHHSSLCVDKFSSHNGSQASSHLATGFQKLQRTRGAPTGGSHDATLLSAGNLVQMQMAQVQLPSVHGPVGARIFFDTGSTRSYVTSSLLQAIGGEIDGTELISIAKFGNNRRTTMEYKKAEINIPTIHGSSISVATLVTNVITCPVQKYPVSVVKNPILSTIPLADETCEYVEGVEIDILIGVDHYYDFITNERISLQDGMLLLGSNLGYIVTGKVSTEQASSAIAVAMCGQSTDSILAHNDIDCFWALEDIGVKDNAYQHDDDKAMQSFNDTVKFSDGRYEVAFPWKEDNPELPDNKGLAFGRLSSNVKRLAKQPKLMAEYDMIIKDQLENGVIETVDVKAKPASSRVHYIPHHAVIRADKATTKLRVVYDASSKSSKKQLSLNECLHRGPVILQDLCGMLIRFRMSKVAIVSDVEKAFLQVGLQQHERDVTRFLWIKDIRKPVSLSNLWTLRFCRVLFGVISSPFLLGGVIKTHLGKQTSKVAADIADNLYVDNVLAGRDSVDEAIAFYHEAKRLFDDISMNIREWYSNSKEFNDQLAPADRGKDQDPKVLGLKWRLTDDSLACAGCDADAKISTKRQLLQCVSSVYDPCGFFSPITIRGKALIQEMWKLKVDWDQQISQEMCEKFDPIKRDLAQIPSVTVPRFVGSFFTGDVQQLHCFCDASAKAYAASCYLSITTTRGTTSTNLIFAKTRLAPIKPITIPRLELMAALVGTRIASFVKRELRAPIQQVTIWSDSKCVLRWIASTKDLPVFVKNRVREINTHSDYHFRYVPTLCNPADIPSRGWDLDDLQSSELWWHGPQFLNLSEEFWPENDVTSVLEDVEELMVGPVVMAGPTSAPLGIASIIDITNHSTALKLLRVSAWVLRFVAKCRKQHGPCGNVGSGYGSTLSSAELDVAERLWLQSVQSHAFPDGYDGNKQEATLVRHLGLFKDGDDGLLKCRGRLRWASLPIESKEPIFLPKNNYFTDLIINGCHEKLFHSGIRHTLAQLRLRYWVPQGTSQVRKNIRKCLVCRKTESGPFKPPESPPLPWFRVSQCQPFQHVGVDYMGPLPVKGNNSTDAAGTTVHRAWICLFTCCATRAIHLEVIPDVTSMQFLMCLRRFSAFYGKPTTMISDNAKHFKSTERALSQVFKSCIVQDHVSSEGIRWMFITELAPWMGGFYERLVGSVKRALRKSVGKLCLTMAQLQTVAVEVSEVVNSRPLVSVDNDINAEVLTPSHFLSKGNRVGLPSFQRDVDASFFKGKTPMHERLIDDWAKGQKILDQFWQIWRNEYLASLRERPSPKLTERNSSDIQPQPGVVVLIKDDLPRSRWRMAVIENLHTGGDGNVRSVTVRLASGKRFNRAVKQLYPIESSLETVPTQPNQTQNGNKQRRQAAVKAQAAIRQMASDESE